MKIRFLGAAGTVTGSRYLLTHDNTRILIDCGLFQGVKTIRSRNWKPFPVHPREIQAVVLTHAHLDHSGYLPRLMREGFHGHIWCTPASRQLAEILLVDSGNLQEEDARHANRYGYSKHEPAEPLYTTADAEKVMKQFRTADYAHPFRIGPFTIHFSPAGHILGSSCVRVECEGQSITFSGDVGRPHDPVMNPPVPLKDTDWLVVESTYGDRLHEKNDIAEKLALIVSETIAAGGTVLMPAFAVGRAQVLMHLLTRMIVHKQIPRVPVYLDSPMAIDVTDVFKHHQREHRLNHAECDAMCSQCDLFQYRASSRKPCRPASMPKIIIAGAGMLNGGRILHHLMAFGGSPHNTLVMTGYQAEGTRGQALLDRHRHTAHLRPGSGYSLPYRATRRPFGTCRLRRTAGLATPLGAAPPHLHHPRRTGGLRQPAPESGAPVRMECHRAGARRRV
jgi:metallo-beta-lactamase family protein